MKSIKVFRVCEEDAWGKPFVLATCTTMEYAEKAIDRLINENYEDEDALYIEEEEIVFDTIYGWDDGDLTNDK
jgi:hypothetical protein